ncbi:MAG TPA: hypothetical protein VHO90_09150 [Bacteroidales bacterium]|nr:hypothetical protein [Bacteroidales bacterium]
MKYLTCLLILLGLIGCSFKSNHDSKSDLLLNHLRQLYVKLPKINLPFTYDLSKSERVSNVYANRDMDSMIFEKDIQVNIAGVLKDTADFFGFIYLVPADEMIPILVTFDKTGRLIEKNQIAQECGSDCGYDCHSYVSIDKDYKIIFKFNETIAKCDSIGPIDSTRIFRETVAISQLEKNGKIKLIEKKANGKNNGCQHGI